MSHVCSGTPCECTSTPYDCTYPDYEYTNPPYEYTNPPYESTNPPCKYTNPPCEYTSPPYEYTSPDNTVDSLSSEYSSMSVSGAVERKIKKKEKNRENAKIYRDKQKKAITDLENGIHQQTSTNRKARLALSRMKNDTKKDGEELRVREEEYRSLRQESTNKDTIIKKKRTDLLLFTERLKLMFLPEDDPSKKFMVELLRRQPPVYPL